MIYSRSELMAMGFRSLGQNVAISKRTTIDNPSTISLGNNVKIGSFVILSGSVEIGNFVHIASFCGLYGGAGIKIGDFISISNFVRLITQSDDYSGRSMSAPFMPDELKFAQKCEAIEVQKHAIIGSGSLLLPGAKMLIGAALGAQSMLKIQTKEWSIYGGVPAKFLKAREKNILNLEKIFWEKYAHNFKDEFS